MSTKHFLVVASVAAISFCAFADQSSGVSPTRAEVIQSVLDARADGTLRHAGEQAPEEAMAYAQAHPMRSNLTRAQEKRTVLAARSDGTLRHAGSTAPEEVMEYAQAHPSNSALTRAEVTARVLQARAAGTLVPAGEGAYPVGGSGGAEFAADRINRLNTATR
jgi:hypothetical protein